MASRHKLPVPILFFLIFCAIIGEATLLIGRLFLRLGFSLVRVRTQRTKTSFGLRRRAKEFFEWLFPFVVVLQFVTWGIRRILPRSTVVRFITFSVLLIFLFRAISGLVSSIVDIGRDLPHPSRLVTQDRDMTTIILDRNGKVLYRLYEQKNRTLIKLEELPPYVAQSTIAIEDKHFYEHIGIDIRGIFRALWTNIRTNRLTGGSTITQQLVKNTLLTPEKTWQRKIRETILAFWTERIYTKDQILQMYLNEVAYGGPAWGIEAAALTYFNKNAKDLTLSEAALLAGLPAAPTTFSPFGPTTERALERQADVFKRMVEDGYITQHEADEAAQKPLSFAPKRDYIEAPHFVMFVRSLLSREYGKKLTSPGGLRITTTLDLDLQQNVETLVQEEVVKLKSLNVKNGAAMITDPRTGEILAMVGSTDYFSENDGNFNVTTALRQPGSSIKPITYALALQHGFTPATIILDTPVSFPISSQPNYSPKNYDNTFHGPVTLREALGNSFNIPAVKLLATLGIQRMIDMAENMGISTFTDSDRYGLSLTLGGGEVTMIDMMRMYGVLAHGGTKVPLTPILKIEDAHGNILEEHAQQATQVVSPNIAYILSHILSDNHARSAAFGALSPLVISNHTVAVKTGTSDNKRDNWTFGYTPSVVAGVWVGNNDNTPMHPLLTSGLSGAAPIWRRIMLEVLKEKDDESFPRPPDVVDKEYTYNSPCPGNSCRGGKDLFIRGSYVRTMVASKEVAKEDGTKEYTYVDGFLGESPEKKEDTPNP
ncbi:MAG: transglycosylase domain-containing protein [bacterium]|nr:transglycosylase domain-containing protein [bacterium]